MSANILSTIAGLELTENMIERNVKHFEEKGKNLENRFQKLYHSQI